MYNILNIHVHVDITRRENTNFIHVYITQRTRVHNLFYIYIYIYICLPFCIPYYVIDMVAMELPFTIISLLFIVRVLLRQTVNYLSYVYKWLP